MKVLLYGTGAIGSLTAHFLVKAGHDVTVAARSSFEAVAAEGLTIRHYLQKKTTIDRVTAVREPDRSVHYDAVFSVMQSQQQRIVAGELAALDTPLIILIGNNAESEELYSYIHDNAAAPRKVLFGFQSSAGHREGAVAVSARLPVTTLYIGELHSDADDETRRLLSELFDVRGYKLHFLADMYGFYHYHIAEIMPFAYLSFRLGHDLKKASAQDIKDVMKATEEAFHYFQSLGIKVMPPGEEKYYEPGLRYDAMYLLYRIMGRTKLGDLMLTDHCRNGEMELRSIDEYVEGLRISRPGPAMPTWDRLREIFEILSGSVI